LLIYFTAVFDKMKAVPDMGPPYRSGLQPPILYAHPTRYRAISLASPSRGDWLFYFLVV
jgi:hypothetical protein